MILSYDQQRCLDNTSSQLQYDRFGRSDVYIEYEVKNNEYTVTASVPERIEMAKRHTTAISELMKLDDEAFSNAIQRNCGEL